MLPIWTLRELPNVEELIHKKTSSLFEPCFIWPWILANYTVKSPEVKVMVPRLQKIARNFGLLFQIADDFEDREQDAKRCGKNVSINYCLRYGVQCAKTRFQKAYVEFENECNQLKIMNFQLKKLLGLLKTKVDDAVDSQP